MELLFLHLDDIKESGERLHEARVESMPTSESVARGQVAASTWASSPQSVKQRSDHRPQGNTVRVRSKETTHCLAVCAWCTVMNRPEDGVQVMTIPSCSDPGACCTAESGISGTFTVLIFFFLIYSLRSLNGIGNNIFFFFFRRSSNVYDGWSRGSLCAGLLPSITVVPLFINIPDSAKASG